MPASKSGPRPVPGLEVQVYLGDRNGVPFFRGVVVDVDKWFVCVSRSRELPGVWFHREAVVVVGPGQLTLDTVTPRRRRRETEGGEHRGQ